jgi:prepilin signal peptidase PulO-like enzyme (type II secretory pathway)
VREVVVSAPGTSYRFTIERGEADVSTMRTMASVASLTTVLLVGSAAAAQAQTTTDTTTGPNPALFLLIGIAFGIACALIANAKGRSPILWGILGFLFGFIPLIIIAVLKKKQPEYTTGYGGPPSVPPPPPV